MNMFIKAGLVFLLAGGLAFLGLMFVALYFGVGGAGNPPLTVWWAPLISLIYNIGLLWFVYLIIGAVLIVVGFKKKLTEKV